MRTHATARCDAARPVSSLVDIASPSATGACTPPSPDGRLGRGPRPWRRWVPWERPSPSLAGRPGRAAHQQRLRPRVRRARTHRPPPGRCPRGRHLRGHHLNPHRLARRLPCLGERSPLRAGDSSSEESYLMPSFPRLRDWSWKRTHDARLCKKSQGVNS
jgi:hypothetical protein